MSAVRLFIAIRVPEEEIADWDRAQVRLKKEIKSLDYEVKWTLPGNYHITLSFLGNISADQTPQIESIMNAVAAQFAPFELELHGIGAFADLMHARVMYLGVQNKKILRSLQEHLETELKLSLTTGSNSREYSNYNSGIHNGNSQIRSTQSGNTSSASSHSVAVHREYDYQPHLTILRFRNPHAVKNLISPFLRKKWGQIKVSELVLYKSEQKGLYPVYTPLYTVKLQSI